MNQNRRLITGEENDVHSKWRHRVVFYATRTGATSAVKRRTRRRERREAKSETRKVDLECS